MTTFRNTLCRRLVMCALTVCCMLGVAAQNKEVPVWPKKHAADVVLTKGKTVQEMGKDNILRIQQMPTPTLQRFDAALSKDKVIIVCPGGGYSILAVDLEGTEIAAWLNSLGYTAYVLRYRVPDNRDGALQDAQRAVRLARAENPGKKVGIMGFSAGAHLSARTALCFDTPAYTATDAVDTLSCRPDFAGLIYPAYLDQGENKMLSPGLPLSDKTPPMFIFQTMDDYYGGSAIAMAKALRENKTPAEVHLLPKGGHGYGLRPQNGLAATTWIEQMAGWLSRL